MQPLRTVKKLPIEDKLQWIESVQLKRLWFDRDSVAQYQSFQPERNAIAKWMRTRSLTRENDNASWLQGVRLPEWTSQSTLAFLWSSSNSFLLFLTCQFCI
jgi:hypothetical protein